MSDDLVDRLNGKYRVPVNDGAGLLNGLDYFERQFPTSPLAKEAAQALTEARAEIERLRAKPPLLDAQSLPGVDALVKTLEAQLDEALRSCLAEREGRLKAEAAISTLRTRVREVVGPFSRLDISHTDDIDDSAHIWEAPCAMNITRGHLRAARQLNEDLTGKQAERDNS